MPTDSRITADMSLAADLLRDGRLIAFATETVYGLGASALDERAVARVFEVKNRPHFDPLIVHIASDRWLNRLVTAIPPAAQQLADAFWPGPLTLVLPKTELVPDLVTAGLSRVAIRIPSHPQALDLLRRVDLPIAAPSANPFGQLSPTTAAHVAATLGDGVDLILDGGPCSIGVESTVVGFDNDRPCILRHGGLTQEDMERVVGPVEARQNPASGPAVSPGMLPQHYAPRTPLSLIDPTEKTTWPEYRRIQAGQRIGLLLFVPDSVPETAAANLATTEVLAPDGSLHTAAANFFKALRRLDAAGLDRILAVPFPDQGLGRALNDRLRRACHDKV